MSINIQLNGETHQLDKGLTVLCLLDSLELDTKKVAIERNLEIVPKSSYQQTAIEDGDVIEIVHFIGGG